MCNWLEVGPVAPTDINQSNRRESMESHLAVSPSESMLASLESGDRTIIKESLVLLDPAFVDRFSDQHFLDPHNLTDSRTLEIVL